MLKNILASMTVATGVALVAAAPASAGDSNGNFQIKAGGTWVNTNDKTNSLEASVLPGTNLVDVIDARASTENTILPTVTLTYYVNKNWALELFCCAGGTSIVGEGALAGLGELAHTHFFPPILTAQYHFDAMGPLRPYVGVGVQWIHYFPKLGSNALGAESVKIDDNVGFALQGGVDFDLGGGWSLGVDVKKVWMGDTKVTWSNVPGLGEVTAKHNLDPLYVTANIGYRFNLGDLFGRRAEPAPLK